MSTYPIRYGDPLDAQTHRTKDGEIIIAKNLWTGESWISRPAPSPVVTAVVNGREFVLSTRTAADLRKGLKTIKPMMKAAA